MEVTAGYFETFQIPVLRGRTFTERDESGPRVAIVNETLAKQFWPNAESVERAKFRSAILPRSTSLGSPATCATADSIASHAPPSMWLRHSRRTVPNYFRGSG